MDELKKFFIRNIIHDILDCQYDLKKPSCRHFAKTHPVAPISRIYSNKCYDSYMVEGTDSCPLKNI